MNRRLIACSAMLLAGCGGSSSSRQPTEQRSATPAPRQAHGFDQALSARLQETLDSVRSDQGIPGASAAVVIPGAGIWTGASGEADTRTHRPVTKRTLFAAGSVTKTFVAALLLKLAERDVLALDDSLSRWVPEFPNSRAITLRQLLNHTAGTANFTDAAAFEAAQQRDLDAVWTPQRTLRYAQEPKWRPGEQWSYSNTNYILAGLVIERATRTTVARELQRLLGRGQRIVLQGDERPKGPLAVGYQNLDEDPELERTPNNGYVPSVSQATAAWTAGGMLASAEALARAGDGIFRGALLSDASRKEMTRFVATRVHDPPEYGLGLARVELGGEQVWAHNGDHFGFHADLAYLPRQQATVVALNNYQQQSPGQDVLVDRLVSDVSEYLRAR